MAARLRERYGVGSFTLGLEPGRRFATLELAWPLAHPDAVPPPEWEAEPFALAERGGALCLRDVARRHGGEQWTRVDPGRGSARYCMQLPLARDVPSEAPSGAGEQRPVFYDFDLFHRPGQTSELERRALAELTYTVFDTETTGLEPSAGDEIISISAVRIVNGRLLRNESFDQLVDPRRPLAIESIRIHGIVPDMLAGQPTIDQVLPRFARFAEDTILVGHNVAFDMRFLELKEAATGVAFVQPVLDTLLLSAVVHPHLDEHQLEANARRLGVPVVGRHTSLGDAIVTGEIFLRLLPLLAAQGIVTLKDALAASQETYLARLRY
jgi:DNA polymerase-3 subunit epsilon